MCIRLEEALGTSAETWLAMQAAYDLWQAKKNKRRKEIARITMEVNRSAA
jgi:antitoxin HigA-1